jgi:hypothetical protein
MAFVLAERKDAVRVFLLTGFINLTYFQIRQDALFEGGKFFAPVTCSTKKKYDARS